MGVNEVRRWLIAYDVREARRLAAVHRYVKRIAVPVQYSVFVTSASARQIEAVSGALSTLIDARSDDVRLYPIPEKTYVHTLGSTMLPADALLLQAGARLRDIIQGSADVPVRRQKASALDMEESLPTARATRSLTTENPDGRFEPQP